MISDALPGAPAEPAPAIFVGWQLNENIPGFPPFFALFNLTRDVPGHCAHSTVTAKTLLRLGFTLDEHFTKELK